MRGPFAMRGKWNIAANRLSSRRRNTSLFASWNIFVKAVRKNICATSAPCLPFPANNWIARRWPIGFSGKGWIQNGDKLVEELRGLLPLCTPRLPFHGASFFILRKFKKGKAEHGRK